MNIIRVVDLLYILGKHRIFINHFCPNFILLKMDPDQQAVIDYPIISEKLNVFFQLVHERGVFFRVNFQLVIRPHEIEVLFRNLRVTCD